MAPFHASNAWMVDFGATAHITWFPNLMYNFKNLSIKFVPLSNHTHVQVVGTDTVKLNNSITVHNVMYVPSFYINLISVPKTHHQLSHWCVFCY